MKNLEETKDFIQLTSLIERIANACYYNYAFVSVDTRTRTLLFRNSNNLLSDLILENSTYIQDNTEVCESQAKELTTDWPTQTETEYIDNQTERAEFFAANYEQCKDLLAQTKLVTCYLLVFLTEEETLVLCSGFLHLFYVTNLKKITHNLKKYTEINVNK